MTKRTVAQIKEAIRQHDDRMLCSENADNFYYTSGRYAKDREISLKLQLELAEAESLDQSIFGY